MRGGFCLRNKQPVKEEVGGTVGLVANGTVPRATRYAGSRRGTIESLKAGFQAGGGGRAGVCRHGGGGVSFVVRRVSVKVNVVVVFGSKAAGGVCKGLVSSGEKRTLVAVVKRASDGSAGRCLVRAWTAGGGLERNY